MKHKLILLVAVLLLAAVVLCGCGKGSVDAGKHAIIKLANGDIVEGEIQSITRWSESLTTVTIDGIEYCVHPLCISVVGE